MFTLKEGQLQHNGLPFFSVGFNYHPSAAGCQYWQKWDAVRIDEDLRQMAQLGFNTVRFFIFWADFEPEPGQYDEEKILRLKRFVSLAARYQIQCIPALLTIWMNGQLFDLPWRDGRDLWTDPAMVSREIAYIRCIAGALRDQENILAYDLGDEIIHVDFLRVQSLSRSAVAAWLQTLADAIREADPGSLVLQGNEASAILGTHQFRPDNARGLDLLAIHGYPVWSPFAIESIASYKASCYPSFLVQFARTYGAVLVDELGCYGGDEEITCDYLCATLHSILANGAQGAIVWCWQDFATKEKPYALHPGERFVGLIDHTGRHKPALSIFQAFAQRATTDWANLSLPAPQIAIHISASAQERGPNYLQPDTPLMSGPFYAYLLLKRAHLPCEFAYKNLERYRLIICPSISHITLQEQEMLADYVAKGGIVYYSTADYLHGFGGEELFGIRLKDFTLRTEGISSFRWQGPQYPLLWHGYEGNMARIPVVKTTTAEVLSFYPGGTPAFTRNTYGQGVAYYLNAPLEAQLNLPFRLDIAQWHTLYSALAEAAGIQREINVDVPDVEVAIMFNATSQSRYGFIINHAAEPVQATVTWDIPQTSHILTEKIVLEGKGVRVLSWTPEQRSQQ